MFGCVVARLDSRDMFGVRELTVDETVWRPQTRFWSAAGRLRRVRGRGSAEVT